MNELTLFLTIILLGLAGLLLIVSSASYYRLGNIKFIFVSIAFLLFLLKALLLIFEIIYQDEIGIFFDFLIIILLYISIIKR